MKFRSKPQEPISPNLTPLIDVVFLLLIFFMVSTSFTRESQLSIALPEANGEPAQAVDKPVEVTIDAEGKYFIEGQSLISDSAGALKQALAKYYTQNSEQAFIIRADETSPYQAVITLLDVAGELGIVNITLATRTPTVAE